MDFKAYQDRAAALAIYPDRGKSPIYPTLGLAGETGEVCEKIKKVLRDDQGVFTKTSREAIAKELGDVLWYITMLADELGYTLDDIACMNLAKLESRQARGTLGGSGDAR